MSLERYFIIKKKTHGGASLPCVFSISKKIYKTAVSRNKIKRQLRAILRGIPLKQETSIVIIPTKEAIGKPYKEIKEQLISEISRFL